MNYIYFSASGTTQKVISILSDAMGDPSVSGFRPVRDNEGRRRVYHDSTVRQ